MIPMFKKTVVLILTVCVLVSATCSAFVRTLASGSSSILRVPQDYSTIQAAVDAASIGDVIFVAEGIYPEYVVVDRSVALVGQNKTTTIIDGNITIFESSVSIMGFTIRNGYPNGITVWDSTNIVISGNIILKHSVGILLSGVNSSIVGANTIASNSLTGVAAGDSYNNTVFGNLISGNKDQNIGLVWSSNNTVIGNRVNSSVNSIILTGNSTNNVLIGNTVSNSSRGIYLDSFMAINNKFYHNSFISNANQVVNETSTVNKWDNGYPSGGNYWSDYTSIDEKGGPEQDQAGSDGIGDAPYFIDVNNRDEYPLMVPWVDVSPPSTTDNYDDLWHTTDFNITLIAEDAKIGVAETYYRINDGLARTVGLDGQPLIFMEGVNRLEYWSVDYAGNEENPHKILAGVKLDKTNPSVSVTSPKDGSELSSSTVTVTWEGTDTASGIDHYEVKLDDESWNNVMTNTTHAFYEVSEGSHRIEVKATDKSGRSQSVPVNFRVIINPAVGLDYVRVAILATAFIVAAFGVWYYFKRKGRGVKARRHERKMRRATASSIKTRALPVMNCAFSL